MYPREHQPMWGNPLPKPLPSSSAAFFAQYRYPRTLAALLVMILSALPCAMAHSKPSRRKFLLTSDIHFNPMADPACCASSSAAPRAMANDPWLPAYRLQPVWRGYESAAARNRLRADELYLAHPAFIMIGGDFLAHEFPTTFVKPPTTMIPITSVFFVLKTVDFLSLQFRERYKNTKIFVPRATTMKSAATTASAPMEVFLPIRAIRDPRPQRRCVCGRLESAGKL